MSDLERLDEALAGADEMIKGDYGVILLGSSPILTAARAYRDLLANGERVWRCERNWRGGESLCREVHTYEPSLHVTCGWRLLVDPTTEEER